MIDSELFYKELIKNEVDFFTGVPDSLLKDICACITQNSTTDRNIIAANEGNSVALATGYYLATEKVPLVYMQNSGFGNAVNPLLSLADEAVYSIPMLLLIGWRGEPGVKDEPQHVKQGKVTLELLETMGIDYAILPESLEEASSLIKTIVPKMLIAKKPFAFVVKKGTFGKYSLKNEKVESYDLTREKAISVLVDHLETKDVVVSTTGKASRELFEIREQNGQSHHGDFLTVGSMGHASQIALGIALAKKDRNVYCFDGDGATLMHTGGMGIVGNLAPQNYKHIILNNGAHESVGGQPTIGFSISFKDIAGNFNYKNSMQVSSLDELQEVLPSFKKMKGPALLEIRVSLGARGDLGRPTTTTIENKDQFIKFLKE